MSKSFARIHREAMFSPRKQYKSLDDKLGFGLHRGQTIREVIEKDAAWLRWAVREADVVLSPEIIEVLNKAQ